MAKTLITISCINCYCGSQGLSPDSTYKKPDNSGFFHINFKLGNHTPLGLSLCVRKWKKYTARDWKAAN